MGFQEEMRDSKFDDVRYMAQLVVKGYTQVKDIDYNIFFFSYC